MKFSMFDNEEKRLKRIFDKFYPKSQTADHGRNLLTLAWIIEIFVVLSGLTVAFIMYTNSAQGNFMDAAGIQIALVFIIASIAELTKIPLATAFYYAVSSGWKLLFLIGLILINILTFDTIISGFNRNFVTQTKDLQALQYDLRSVEIKLVRPDLEAENKIQKNNNEINKLNKQINEVNLARETADKDFESKLENIYALSADGPTIKNLAEQRQTLQNDKSTIIKQINDAQNKRIQCDDGGIVGILKTTQCDRLETSITRYKSDLKLIDNKISTISNELNRLTVKAESNNKDKKLLYEQSRQATRERLDREEQQLLGSRKQLIDANNTFNEGKLSRAGFVEDLQKKKQSLIQEINNKAIDNQFYNIAMYLKSNDNNEVKVDDKLGSETNALISPSNKQYHLLTQDDLDFAFKLFFGVIALVVSLAGTLLALAANHLQDPRSLEERNKAKQKSLFRKLLDSFRYVLLATRKRLMEPKVIEKEIKVEVEKEVIKEVPVEKVVYKEIPKEVVRRELVHLPLYTNDKELLANNPFNDTDISDEELKDFLEKKRKDKEDNE